MKVTSCAGKTSKVFLLFVNILTFLLGGTCIGLGIWYHLDGGLYDKVRVLEETGGSAWLLLGPMRCLDNGITD